MKSFIGINVPLFLKDPKFYKRVGSQILLELQNLSHAVNTVTTVTADSSVKELAGAVMSEYSSPFSAISKLRPGES